MADSSIPASASDGFATRHALVIGAETPAGRAIALALGRAGMAVGLAAMRADEGVLAARRVQRALQADGRVATTYAFDVTLGQNVKVSTRQVTKELGGLDVVVSASDLFLAGPLRGLTESDIGRVTASNFHAHAYAARAAADEFRRGEGGHVLLMVHAVAERGMPGAAAYASTQAASLALVRSLAEEWREARVGVNAIVVGDYEARVEGASGLAHLPLRPGEDEALGRLVLAIVGMDPGVVTGRTFRADLTGDDSTEDSQEERA